MTLHDDEVKRFYGIFMPLLTFVNSRKNLLPQLETWDLDHPISPEDAKLLRDVLWAERELLEEFAAENPARLDAKDLTVALSWRHALNQSYMVVKHLKRHSIFAAKGNHYAVLGLASPLQELLPSTPALVETTLLPFEGRITYDSLIGGAGPKLSFGPGIRRRCNEEYQEARRAGLIIHSLGD